MDLTRPSLVDRVSKTINRVRHRGLREVGGLVASRARSWIGSRDVLILMVRTTDDIDMLEHDVTARWARSDDASRYARDIATDSERSFLERIGDATTRCFIVEDSGRIAHASWVTTSGAWTREIGGYLCPPPGDAYVYESFTHPNARGKGMYPIALRGILEELHRDRVGRVWVGVDESNEPSRRAIGKAGFREGFRLAYGRRFGRLDLGPVTGPDASTASVFLRRHPYRRTGVRTD